MIKNTPLEYTQDEFNAFVEKHNYEVFSAETVNAFCKDLLEKSEKNEIDEFEKSCAAADFVSLTPAIIVGNDLVKRTVYYRENQTEEVEIPDGIFKSINDKMCRKFKETSLNILKGIAGINCADEDAIEKAKALPIGTEKTYGGKLYVKTEKGWRLKAKGTRSSSKNESTQKEELDKKFNQKRDEMRSEYEKKIEEFENRIDEASNREERAKIRKERDDYQKKFNEAFQALIENQQKELTKEVSKNESKQKKESEKEELDEDGELVTVTHDKDKFERYRLFRDLYAARMKRGTSPKLAKEGYLKNSGDVNKKGNEKYYELLKEFGDKKYTYSEKQPKKNKFAREIEEARKIGEQLRKEHEQRVASGQKIGSDDPRDRSKLIGFNKK
jgi:hypothetical protein